MSNFEMQHHYSIKFPLVYKIDQLINVTFINLVKILLQNWTLVFRTSLWERIKSCLPYRNLLYLFSFFQGLFTTFDITAIVELTLGANVALADAQRLQWHTTDSSMPTPPSKSYPYCLVLGIITCRYFRSLRVEREKGS